MLAAFGFCSIRTYEITVQKFLFDVFHMYDVKEEFLYCNALKTTATAQDVMDNISELFETEGLQWEKLFGVCTDEARAMLGRKSGFQIKAKEKSPQVKGVHCMTYSFDLKKFF